MTDPTWQGAPGSSPGSPPGPPAGSPGPGPVPNEDVPRQAPWPGPQGAGAEYWNGPWTGPPQPEVPQGAGELPPPWYELPAHAVPPAGPGSAEGDLPGSPASGAPGGKGLFGSLFDRSFDNLATVKLLRMLYTLAMLCVTGFNLILFLFGWSLAAGSFWPFLGWTMIIGVPVMWLAELIMVRVVTEYLIVQHKIASDLSIVREAVKDIRAARS
jgi:hypothetical protein